MAWWCPSHAIPLPVHSAQHYNICTHFVFCISFKFDFGHTICQKQQLDTMLWQRRNAMDGLRTEDGAGRHDMSYICEASACAAIRASSPRALLNSSVCVCVRAEWWRLSSNKEWYAEGCKFAEWGSGRLTGLPAISLVACFHIYVCRGEMPCWRCREGLRIIYRVWLSTEQAV